jgi:transcriptional regulator with GAF, ATPase, and Fis domain
VKTEQRLTEIFVELADTLVDQFDALDFLHTLTERSVELLHVDAAGVILSDQHGHLQVVASTSNRTEDLELFELECEEGPCLDCLNTGQAVANVGATSATQRWPRFSAAFTEAGYQSAHAVPLRLRSQVIGAMNLFCIDHMVLTEADLALAQALADVATIGLLQERAIHEADLIAEQLQTALNSRTLIEQSKGVLHGKTGISVDEAFRLMREYSRRTQTPLRDVAGQVIESSITPDDLFQV